METGEETVILKKVSRGGKKELSTSGADTVVQTGEKSKRYNAS